MYHRPIRFHFDERKTTEAAAFLLQLAGGDMEYLRLIKLLYLAERESLRLYGWPISGDWYVSMKNGPVLSQVLDLIKSTGGAQSKLWSDHIVKSGFNVRLVQPMEPAALSRADLDVLRLISEKYRGVDKWSLERLTHDFPEWQDPGRSSIPIEPDDILRALGKTDAELEEIRRATVADEHFRKLFAPR